MPEGEDPIESLAAHIIEANEQIASIRAQLNDVGGRGTAASGRVSAEVSAEGRLTGLKIDSRAMRLGSEALAEEILTAVFLAQEKAAAAAAETLGPAQDAFFSGGGPAGGEDGGHAGRGLSTPGGPDDGERAPDFTTVLAALNDLRGQIGLD